MSIDCNRCGDPFDSMDHLTDHLVDVHDAFTDVVRGVVEPTVSIELPLRDVIEFVNTAEEQGDPLDPVIALRQYSDSRKP